MRTYEYGNLDAQTVLIQPVDDHELPLMEKEWQEIRNLTDKDVLLIAVKVNSWNDDLSPWEAPAMFGKDGFGGRAEKMLEIIRQLCQENSNSYYLGGYSLAGCLHSGLAIRCNLPGLQQPRHQCGFRDLQITWSRIVH